MPHTKANIDVAASYWQKERSNPRSMPHRLVDDEAPKDKPWDSRKNQDQSHRKSPKNPRNTQMGLLAFKQLNGPLHILMFINHVITHS